MAIGGLSPEQQARRLAVQLSAKFKHDKVERITTVRIGKRKQQFWMGSWPTIAEWLRDQQSNKRRKGS